MKEKHFVAAFEEYRKRLGAFCKFELVEITEQRLSENPSDKEIESALLKEAQEIEKNIPASSAVIAMCIEGTQKSSTELADVFQNWQNGGKSRLCFLIGGSFGMHESIKKRADLRLSMSKMTFPHHLARIMVMEQLYRSEAIQSGSKYHK